MRNVIAGGLLSVLMMSTAAHATPSPIASTTVVDFSTAYPGYAADNVVGGNPSLYWLLADGVTTGFVTIDLGATYNISSLIITDTHNGIYNDRGTNAFTIGFGSSAMAAETSPAVYSGNFLYADWLNSTPMTINVTGTARYVTFDINSAYGNSTDQATFVTDGSRSVGGGLASISVLGALPSAVPEPISMAILGAGLLGLVGVRFRKS